MASEKAKKGPSKRHLERKRARGIALPETSEPPSHEQTPEMQEPDLPVQAITEPQVQVAPAYAVVTVLPAVTVLPTVPPPFIHDPGNGPRVLDVSSFLHSPFADPVCTTDPRVSRHFGYIHIVNVHGLTAATVRRPQRNRGLPNPASTIAPGCCTGKGSGFH